MKKDNKARQARFLTKMGAACESLKALRMTISESSLASSIEPILPIVAKAKDSQLSFPQVKSDLIALITLSNSF